MPPITDPEGPDLDVDADPDADADADANPVGLVDAPFEPADRVEPPAEFVALGTVPVCAPTCTNYTFVRSWSFIAPTEHGGGNIPKLRPWMKGERRCSRRMRRLQSLRLQG